MVRGPLRMTCRRRRLGGIVKDMLGPLDASRRIIVASPSSSKLDLGLKCQTSRGLPSGAETRSPAALR